MFIAADKGTAALKEAQSVSLDPPADVEPEQQEAQPGSAERFVAMFGGRT